MWDIEWFFVGAISYIHTSARIPGIETVITENKIMPSRYLIHVWLKFCTSPGHTSANIFLQIDFVYQY